MLLSALVWTPLERKDATACRVPGAITPKGYGAQVELPLWSPYSKSPTADLSRQYSLDQKYEE